MALERLWAGWRTEYVSEPARPSDPHACVFCALRDASDDVEALVVERAGLTFTVMNLFPYTSGHVMVVPDRHVGELDALTDDETVALAHAQRRAVTAVKAAYAPEGINTGINLGRAAGAGIPGHLHVHVVPRWSGDTNFMTAVAEARVLPERLADGYERLRAAWPR